MSGLHKTTKININFQSSGSFLNVNKPKFLSLGKFYNINNIKVKNNNNDISQDTFHMENISRQTESSSKDEIIRALKERLTVLEKKVKILETENNENTSKINFLNLSHGNHKKMNNQMKLNIKIFRNKKNFNNAMNISSSKISKKENSYKNEKIQKNFNNLDIKKHKKRNETLNFFDSINTSGFHTNINKFKNKMKISKSVSKYNNFTIIPKNSSKKKVFIDLLKRKKIRFATIGNERESFKEEIKDKLKSIKPKEDTVEEKEKSEKSENSEKSEKEEIKEEQKEEQFAKPSSFNQDEIESEKYSASILNDDDDNQIEDLMKTENIKKSLDYQREHKNYEFEINHQKYFFDIYQGQLRCKKNNSNIKTYEFYEINPNNVEEDREHSCYKIYIYRGNKLIYKIYSQDKNNLDNFYDDIIKTKKQFDFKSLK